MAALETIGGAIFFITKLMIAATCALVCYIWLGPVTEETHSIVYPTFTGRAPRLQPVTSSSTSWTWSRTRCSSVLLRTRRSARQELAGEAAPRAAKPHRSHQSDAANPDMIATVVDQA